MKRIVKRYVFDLQREQDAKDGTLLLLLMFLIFRFCFVLFLLDVPVNNFSVMSGWSHRFLGITSTLGK